MNLMQDNFSNTPLPNGLLRWFGFDFDRAELPEEPLLPRGESPIWVGQPPLFQYKNGISDARVIIEIDDWSIERDPLYDNATPKRYQLAVYAHGFNQAQTSVWPTWHDVQQAAQTIEQELDQNFVERHNNCQDDNGNETEDTCAFCAGRQL